MNKVLTLLRPRIIGVKRYQDQDDGKKNMTKAYLFAGFGLVFWLGIFAVFFKVLSYFQQIEGFGDILAQKLLSMVFITFFALLIFSGIIACLSKLYLSRDLQLVHSYPVAHHKIFLARWIEATFDSSWMVFIYAMPAFFSYGIVYQMGLFFYLNMIVVLILFCVCGSAISALAVMTVVTILPANRLRGLLIFLGLGLFVGLYIFVRFLRPERLVDPDMAASVASYIASLETPASVFLPSTWAFDSMRAALQGKIPQALFHNALAASAAGTMIMVTIWFSKIAYFTGVTKSQISRTGAIKAPKAKKWRGKRFFPVLSGPARALFVKEVKTFFRDSTQWPQVFLLAALIAIYVYNFKVLPLEKAPIKTVYLQNVLAFLNMGLAAFVLTAITARFAFPAVSQEKKRFWIVQAGPVSIKTMIWIKFFIYLAPLLVLSEILVVATNILLMVTPFMMWLSIITVFCMVPGIVAMGIGLGAAYPDFASENPAQTVTSYGGLMFMLLGAAFIAGVIVLEAGPVYSVVYSGFKDRAMTNLELIWLVVSFGCVFALCIAAVFLPMRFGARRLSAW